MSEVVKKKIISKNEFYELNEKAALAMSKDEKLQMKALGLLSDADRHRWIHQNTWLGEPLLNLPQDMFALQEIIWQTQPDYIIEVGVAWGGSLLFESTLLGITKGKKVIGIDIFIPDDLKQRLYSHGEISDRIALIEGGSTSLSTLQTLESILQGSKRCLIILDSHHTHDHVLAELNTYQQFVGQGQYLICCDTVIEYMPEQKHRPREWGPGNSPATALKEFLKTNKRFKNNELITNKLLFSCHPGGYLKAVS